jgi:PAS domain S-box-containing protein
MNALAAGPGPISAQEWRQIVDSAIDTAIITTDINGLVTSWNEGARRILGWTQSEMEGQTLERLFPDGTGHLALKSEMEDALASGRGGGEEGWRVRKDGSLIWAAGEMSPIRGGDDQIVGFTKILRDRSSKRESEQALVEERKALEVLNRAGSALAAENDLQQLVQIVTDAGVELTGAEFGAFFYNSENESGESYMLYTLSGAPAEAFSQFPMPRNTQVFGPTFSGEGIVRSSDITKDPRYGRNEPYSGMPAGHLPVRSYLAVSVFSRTGEVLGGLFFGHAEPGVFSERSERGLQGLAAEAAVAIDNARLFRALERELDQRRAAETSLAESEARLRILNEQLEQEVQAEIARRSEVEEALRQSQKMEAVGQLTGGIAHDFNNLLAGISGSLELINRRISEGRTQGIERFISGAQTSAQRAAALTQRLLAFSRRQTLDPKPTDVNRLVLGMEDLIHSTVGPAIKLEVVGAAGLWPAKVDTAQLESALLNLVINARDAMPEGGQITIETANKWLDDRASYERDLPPGQYISICVTDTGTGIPKDIAARIFDPFFTTKPIGQGTGLGLSMIHGFVRQSGGQIRVYSEPGEGTTMCLYFPRYRGDVDEETGVVPAQIAEVGAGQTVLVIDDEPVVRMLILEVLAEAGYSALEAEDGPTGLKILEAVDQLALLITDVGLPGGMNGRQVADAARIAKPDLKVLFVTGFAENAAVANGHLEPGMAVITKPFVMTELAAKIEEMIEK